MSSGRFAMIDDGFGFQLAPWQPVIEGWQGEQINELGPGGGVDWQLGRDQSLGT